MLGTVAGAIALAGLPTGPASSQEAPSAAPSVTAPAGCGTAFPRYAPREVASEAVVLADQAITMSDGVVLRADVHLPAGVDGPVPTALTITGYGKSLGAAAFGTGVDGLLRHGYATMTVDDRGTGASGGMWDSWSERTLADYPEILDWVVAQPWSDGDVAMVGASYMGITSLFAAASGHPAVKAVFATVPMGDAFRDIVLGGGQVNTAFIPLWMGLVTGLGLVPTGDQTTLVDHLLAVPDFQLPSLLETTTGGDTAYDGPFWRQRSPLEVADQIDVPTFIVGGLDDLFQRGEPMLYEALADHTDARLLIGPWNHLTTGQGLPRDGVPPLGELNLQWFDAHVRGIDTGAQCIPQVTQYVTGAERYATATTWPRPDVHAARWHLRSDATLTPEPPAGAEPGRQYLQLPITGACTRSANQWLIGALGSTPCASDNRLDEALSLTYTTAPFTEDVRIDGPIEADLWLSSALGGEASSAVAVSSVAPDGTSRGLTNGLLSASHRAVDPTRARLLDGQSIQPWHPFTRAAQLTVPAGEPVLAPVEVFPTSAVIPAGHRLRVTVAAYDVPHALPPLPQAAAGLGGPVTVLSDATHPSSIAIPVVAAAGAAPTPATAVGTPAVGGATAGAGTGRLPATGGAAPLMAAAVVLAVGLLLRRASAH
jgi:putative CocE/NonD family hydrolase